MNKLLKNIAFYLALLWVALIIVRFNFLIDVSFLLVKFVHLIYIDFNFAITQLDIRLLDFFLSYFIFLLLGPCIAYLYIKNLPIKNYNYGLLILSILIVISLTAPVLSPSNPEEYKDLNSTKLLKPFTTLNYVVFKNSESIENIRDRFVVNKNKVFARNLERKIIYFDKIEYKTKINLDQGEGKIEIDKNDLIFKNDSPLIRSRLFVLGTDEFGRDILSRILYGLRLSLFIGLGSVFICVVIGISFGFVAGYFGKWLDLFLSRIADLFLTFPSIFLVVLALALFGNNLLTVIIVLGLSGWMSLYKIVKGEVISIKQKDYFLTAQKIGLNGRRLLLKEVIPVIASPVIVNLLLQFSNVVLAESALSYLGLGVGFNYPSLGSMINSGQEYFTQAWWLSLFPGITIIGIIFIFNSIGEKLNAKLNSRILQ